MVAPDGALVPDIAGRLPGRGLWLTHALDIVAAATAKRSFARAARAPVAVPEDLAGLVERLLASRCRDVLGLARRAGVAVGGFEKVREGLLGSMNTRVFLMYGCSSAGQRCWLAPSPTE